GLGSEYRYNMGGGSDGIFRIHMLDEHEVTYIVDGVEQPPTPARQSYDIRANANQLLPGHLRARANVSYFSSIVSSQTFNTNIYDASRNQRSFGGNIIGAWRSYTLNATLDHSEYFYSTTDSSVSGSWPRIQFARNERPLPGSPAYFSVTTEVARLLRQT